MPRKNSFLAESKVDQTLISINLRQILLHFLAHHSKFLSPSTGHAKRIMICCRLGPWVSRGGGMVRKAVHLLAVTQGLQPLAKGVTAKFSTSKVGKADS